MRKRILSSFCWSILVGSLLAGCATSEPLSDKDYIRAMDRQNESEWNRQLQMM